MKNSSIKKYIVLISMGVGIFYLLKGHPYDFLIIISYIILSINYFLHFFHYENIPKLKKHNIILITFVILIYSIIFFYNGFNTYILLFLILYLINFSILFTIYNKWKTIREHLTFAISVPKLREVILNRAQVEKDLQPLQDINNQLEEERIIVNKIFYQLKELNATSDIDKVIYIAYKDLKEILDIDNFIVEIKKDENKEMEIVLEENIDNALKKFYNEKKITFNNNILNYTNIEINTGTIKKVNIFPLVVNQDIIGRIIIFEKQTDTISISKIKHIVLISHQIAMALKKSLLYKRVQELSRKDGLTNLFLHRVFEEKLYAEYTRAKRYKTKLSLIMMDIDHFKKINDTYGHLIGDKILKEVANVIISKTDPPLFTARYGGEEFTIICPAYTKRKAFKLAEDIRDAVKRIKVILQTGETIGVTISGGVEGLTAKIKSADTLLKNADDALYKAKENGRDQIIINGYKKL